MNAAQLAAALGKAHREGHEWRSLCPAHADHDPTLSIRDKDGKVLVNCRAGCSQDDVIAAIKARGLWEEPRESEAAPKIVAEYDYVTAEGEKSYQVVRREPGKNGRTKDFLQRRRVGADWVWKLDGTERVPYHLDELVRARAACINGTPWRVYIPEGEKCVDRMREQWQATATTCPGGAGKWRHEYNPHFRGADAVILPDNDKPGHDHALAVAAQLHGIAAVVTVVDLPGLEPKEDIFDWIAKGHTEAELESLVQETKNTPPPPPRPARATKAKTPEPPEPPDERKWIYARGGGLAASLTNAITLLRVSPQWQNLVAFDEFANTVHITGTPPWAKTAIDRAWTDIDNNLATDWIQQNDLNVGRDIAAAAITTIAHDRAFHPVRAYFERCRWDGTPRLDGWATTYLGVAPTWREGPDGPQPGYVETVAARWMISAVARILAPGCKADCALILEGPQDRKKSTALRTLADPWFTDDFSEFGSKDAAIETAGVWIIELAELDSINRADTNKIKSFMSRQIDRYRPPYALIPTLQPRQCIFAGTVNHSEYLKDETGGRRFWPLRTGRIDIDALAADRDQLWAEARDRYLSGERWYLSGDDSPEIVAAARAEQQQRYLPDAWDEIVVQYIQKFLLKEISIGEALRDVIGLEQADWTQRDQNRIARCLRNLNWTRRQTRSGREREWRYYAPSEAE